MSYETTKSRVQLMLIKTGSKFRELTGAMTEMAGGGGGGGGG